MVNSPMLKIILAISVVVILITPIAAAYAESTQWLYGSYSITPKTEQNLPPNSGNMMKMTNIRHNGNLLIKEVTLPHINVAYPDLLNIDDNPGDLDADPPNVEVLYDWEPEETIFQVYFYFECTKEEWQDEFLEGTNYSCYKYKQFYTLDDGDASQSPRFRMTVQVFGPGFGPNPCGCKENHGYPTYRPEWKVDTDMPGGGQDYARHKQTHNPTTWLDLTPGPPPGNNKYEDRYIALTGQGQEWRTNDVNTGWSKSFGIDPIGVGDVTITRYYSYEVEPLYLHYAVDDFDNGEAIYGYDIVIWYRGERTADADECVIGHPCKIESNLIPNGGW